MLKKLTKNELKKKEKANTYGGDLGWFQFDLCDGYCYSHCGTKECMAGAIRSGQDVYQT